mmetsp:Transcript_71483/g.113711  ORF Transcript_71483/g.113711 Transcript_71483/m.113711 type:complete len:261 (-) Transcript_71483:616-1398(-)
MQLFVMQTSFAFAFTPFTGILHIAWTFTFALLQMHMFAVHRIRRCLRCALALFDGISRRQAFLGCACIFGIGLARRISCCCRRTFGRVRFSAVANLVEHIVDESVVVLQVVQREQSYISDDLLQSLVLCAQSLQFLAISISCSSIHIIHVFFVVIITSCSGTICAVFRHWFIVRFLPNTARKKVGFQPRSLQFIRHLVIENLVHCVQDHVTKLIALCIVADLIRHDIQCRIDRLPIEYALSADFKQNLLERLNLFLAANC